MFTLTRDWITFGIFTKKGFSTVTWQVDINCKIMNEFPTASAQFLLMDRGRGVPSDVVLGLRVIRGYSGTKGERDCHTATGKVNLVGWGVAVSTLKECQSCQIPWKTRVIIGKARKNFSMPTVRYIMNLHIRRHSDRYYKDY
jgi:hypothetical protein